MRVPAWPTGRNRALTGQGSDRIERGLSRILLLDMVVSPSPDFTLSATQRALAHRHRRSVARSERLGSGVTAGPSDNGV